LIKKSVLWMGKILLPTLLVLALTVIISVETASTLSTITQTNPATTVYLDPPTVNGTAIGVNNTVTVNINITDAHEVHTWSAGLNFNATLLECTGFFEGEFLKNVGSTLEIKGTINNTAGVITPYCYALKGMNVNASGDGRLAYVTFKVKALGVSDLHFWDVTVLYPPAHYPLMVPANIIDVYTVIVDAAANTVVTVSNSTGVTGAYHSGFYNHVYNPDLKEISFNVTGPFPGFSNVTIPDTLLWGDFSILIDGMSTSKTLTYNGTHFSLYFTYSQGVHEIVITTRPLVSSTISMDLSSTTITLGESVTISGKVTPADNTTRADVPVTISYRPSDGTWTTFATVKTTQYSNYSYTWTQNKTGTYEFKVKWDGDKFPGTIGAESDVKTLTVLGTPVAIYVFDVVVKGEVLSAVIESNFTVSNFAFNETLKEIYFDITGIGGNTHVCNVIIPKGLLWCENLADWIVRVDAVSITPDKTKNETHTSLYFTYLASIHHVRITTRVSTISMDLSSTTITLGESVIISGAIDPLRPSENVTIQYRLNGGTWASLVNMTTHSKYGNYSYTWTPLTAGTYEFKAFWDGDPYINPAESEVKTLIVEEAEKAEGIPLEVVIVAVVAIIVIAAAVAVYFVKFRKPR